MPTMALKGCKTSRGLARSRSIRRHRQVVLGPVRAEGTGSPHCGGGQGKIANARQSSRWPQMQDLRQANQAARHQAILLGPLPGNRPSRTRLTGIEYERERAIGRLLDRRRARAGSKFEPADGKTEAGRHQQNGARNHRWNACFIRRPRPRSGLHDVIQVQVVRKRRRSIIQSAACWNVSGAAVQSLGVPSRTIRDPRQSSAPDSDSPARISIGKTVSAIGESHLPCQSVPPSTLPSCWAAKISASCRAHAASV